jgi:cardiolipin synthase
MSSKNTTDQAINIPNALSSLRISMSPVLLYLAFAQNPAAFLFLAVLTEITDALDGYVARRLHQVTELGSHLDSAGDFIIYATLAFSALVLWPDIVLEELVWFVLVICSFTLPALVGYIKYHHFTSFHTRSVKAAAFTGVVGYLLMFSNTTPMVFKVAAVLSVIAGIEEIAISLLSREDHVDVRSLWHALKTVNTSK